MYKVATRMLVVLALLFVGVLFLSPFIGLPVHWTALLLVMLGITLSLTLHVRPRKEVFA